MKYQFITIEREYGSGGSKIARRLAEECGIACYGEEILERVAEKNDVPVEKIKDYEENVSNSFLYTVFVMSRAQSANADMLMGEGYVYLEEQEVIKELALKGPAVFLGHCASEALKERRGVVRVFIHADKESKEKRIMEDYQIHPAMVDAAQKQHNKKRASYYRANTMKNWDDYKNYDIVLDSSQLGIEGCVAVLKGLLTENQ